MGMGGSSWAKEGKNPGNFFRSNVNAARLGLVLTASTIGNTLPALAQENVTGGQDGVRISQQIRNATPVSINGVSDLLNKWTADRNLYIQGGSEFTDFSREEQNALAKWLASNHPTWTVVFVGDSSGQDFRGHSEEKAYEFAIGQSLMGSNRFAAIKDPETGLKSGATLLIVNAPNHWMAWGSSQLQEKYGLDYNTRWVGGFDEILKPELRRNRWADGVQNVITAIDGELNQSIESEHQQAARRLAAAREQVSNASAALENLPTQLEEFRKSYPKVKSEIAYPNTENFKDEIERAQKQLDANHLDEANQLSRTTIASIHSIIDRMNQFSADGKSLDTLPDTIAQAQKSEFHNHGDHKFQEAKLLLERTRVLWNTGDPQYADSLKLTNATFQEGSSLVNNAQRADREIQRLTEEIEKTKTDSFHESGDSLLKSAVESLQRAQKDLTIGNPDYASELSKASQDFKSATDAIHGAAIADATKKGLGLLAILGVSGLLAGSNLGRRGTKQKAEKLYRENDTAIGEKSSELMAFDERAARRLKGAKLSGVSAIMAQEIIEGIPPLYVMITSAQEVLDRAEKLMQPGAANLFSRKNYAAAISLLEREPVTWDRDSDLPDAIRGKKLESTALWMDLVDFKDFSMSFTGIVEHFNRAAKSLDEKLTALEHADESVITREETIEASIKKLQEIDLPDGLKVVNIAGVTIPAIKKRLEAAQSIMFSDPVTADGLLAALQLQLNTPVKLVESLQNGAAAYLPAIQRDQQWCEENGIKTPWIQAELTALVESMNSYLKGSSDQEPQTKAPNPSEELENIATRAARAHAQGVMLREKYPETLKTTSQEIEEGRAKIISELSIPANMAFAEKGEDPDDMISKATAAAKLAETNITEGSLDKAEASLIEASDLFAQAKRLSAMSLESMEKQKEWADAVNTNLTALKAREPQMQLVLQGIKNDFAESVLTLSSGDPAHPRANNTISDNIQEVESSFEQIVRCLSESAEAYKQGQLLHSAALMRQAEGLVSFASFRYDEIAEKKTALDAAVASNEQLTGQLNTTAAELKAEIEQDKIIGQSTLRNFTEQFETLQKTSKIVGANNTDPFAIAKSIKDITEGISDVRDQIADDRENYQSAGDAIANAKSELLQIKIQLEHIQNSGAGTSSDLQQAKTALEDWQTEITTVSKMHLEERGDWAEVARLADRVVRKGAEILARMKNEAEEVEEAIAKMKAAEKRIKEARSWSGSYNVRVSGSPGQSNLQQAQTYLQNGDYDRALSAANSAWSASNSAIKEAEALVAKKRREEQEEEDRQRRARRAAEAARQAQASYSSISSSSSSNSGMGGSSFTSGGSSGMGGSSW